jgi:hypothetical protein
MKKIIFLSLILGFIFSIFPFSAKGQEALYKNAEIVKKLYVTRGKGRNIFINHTL